MIENRPIDRRMDTWFPRVSLVIPALNEARNLPHVFAELPPDLYEVVLVDGGSSDDTATVARSLWPEVRIVRQSRCGKGNALACGVAACRGDIIVMLDADGSTSPAEIPRFVAALVEGADVAKGSRFVADGGSSDITPLRRVVNALYGTGYTDLCYGYNAFWSGCLPLLGLDPGRPLDGDDGRTLWGDGFEAVHDRHRALGRQPAGDVHRRGVPTRSFERPCRPRWVPRRTGCAGQA
jgi:glycosyltransferase involved in cell wall biosynthesis